MKKTIKLFLAAIMVFTVISAIPLTVGANPAAFSVSDDFNDNSIDTTKWTVHEGSGWKDNSESTGISHFVKEENGMLNCAYSFPDHQGIEVVQESPITSGIIHIKVDSKKGVSQSDIDNSTGDITGFYKAAAFFIAMGPSAGSAENYYMVYDAISNNEVKLQGNSTGATSAPDEWKTYDLYVDLDSNTVILSVTNASGVQTVTTSALNTSTFKNISNIYIGGKYTLSCPVLIDNVSITYPDNLPGTLPITDQFDSGSINFLNWNLSNTSCVAVNNGTAEITGGLATPQGLGVNIGTPVTNGTVYVKFDAMFPALYRQGPYCEFNFYTGTGDSFPSDSNILFSIKGGDEAKLIGNSTGMMPTADDWYTYELYFDLNKMTVEVQFSPQSGGTKTVLKGNLNSNFTSLQKFFFGGKWIDQTTPQKFYIDNVTIKRHYETPAISGITFVKHDDTQSTALTNVPAGTKSIDVSLNTLMNESTLSSSTITLQNITDSTQISYTGSYNSLTNVWSIPLSSFLKPNKTYRLSLTSNAQNGEGTAAIPTYSEFSTDAGEYSVNVSLWKNSTEITQLSQLQDGDTITVKAAVINTKASAQHLLLLFCGYNANKLTAYQASEKQLTAEDVSVTYSDFTVTVDKDTLSMFKVFAWQDYDTLKPIVESYQTVQ